MPTLDELPADQKAVLQLLLKRGKTYDDIANLLRLDQAAVRERALDALDALGPDHVAGLSAERQDEVADHLLLQQTASERAATREFLEDSAAGRTWGRAVAAELRPIGGDALPAIPAEPAEQEAAFGALDERTRAAGRQERSSRLGGVLVLLAGGIVLALVILFLAGAFSGNDSTSTDADDPPATSSGATGTTGGGGSLPDQQINLTAPKGGSKSTLGLVLIQQGGLALQAQGLPPDTHYAVWFSNPGGASAFLGFAQFDTATKRLYGASTGLPKNVRSFARLIVTREKVSKPKRPGHIVLQGTFKPGTS